MQVISKREINNLYIVEICEPYCMCECMAVAGNGGKEKERSRQLRDAVSLSLPQSSCFLRRRLPGGFVVASLFSLLLFLSLQRSTNFLVT